MALDLPPPKAPDLKTNAMPTTDGSGASLARRRMMSYERAGPAVACTTSSARAYNSNACRRYRGEPTGTARIYWEAARRNRTAARVMRTVAEATVGVGALPVTRGGTVAKVAGAIAKEITRSSGANKPPVLRANDTAACPTSGCQASHMGASG